MHRRPSRRKRSPTSASRVSSSSSKSPGNRRRPESAEINDERRPAAAHPGRLLRILMKFVNKPYGCFCHQLSIVTPNNGMYFGCASLLE
jgi:hypothetical protein